MRNLLIEIGVEELPAEPLIKELKNIEKKWQKILKENRLETKFSFFYTPRRLVFWHPEFLEKQPDEIKEMFGPPLAIAYQNGEPTRACESFAKKCGVPISELETGEKNGKEVLYFKIREEGKTIHELLENMVLTFLKSLNFGKNMRWGEGKYNFIRPVRWVLALFGKENIPITIFGVKSRAETRPHRNALLNTLTVEKAGDYFCNLPKNGVIIKQSERELHIRYQIQQIERENDFKVEIDTNLLKEVIAITENPTSLVGTFEEKFLKLPSEVIITSMREHQRYFPVYKNGKLTNKFVFVSNALTDDFSQIILGNERVLRARLSDALFFHDNDLKRGLTTEGLNEIVFVKGLGTMQDKINRELQIAKFLGKQYNCEKMELLERAVSIAKADLTTEMVYEFTELQGIMGGYYAKQLGEAPEVVTAIYEQYFPNSENGELPSTVLSAIVAISYKLDLLFALFSIGHIPTGSRDPFGLRRAVNGILRIVLKHNLKFNFDEVLDNLVENYKQIDRKILKKFISERIINFYKDINPSIIKSVLEVENEILNIDAKIKAVTKFVEKDDFAENLSTFKRVANILKGIKNKVEVNPELFLDDAEKELYNYFQEIQAKNTQTFEEKLNDLFSIKPHLDNFFNKVMVNVEDKKIRQNRIALINIIYQEFLKISDIVKITV